VERLIAEYYRPRNLQLRGCHPRDLLEQARSLALYLEQPFELTPDLLEAACASYFVDARSAAGGPGSTMRARVLTGVLAALVAAVSAAGISLRAAQEDPSLAVRITSPLGRTGLPGPIRIVAQIQQASAVPPREVRFFVDQQLLRTVDRAPWVAEWTDSNPFERSEIVVEVVDDVGTPCATASCWSRTR
jgi:hypothetical protein